MRRRAGADAARAAAHGRPRHARHRGSGAARRSRAGAVGAAGARARRGRARRAAAARPDASRRSSPPCTGSSPSSASSRRTPTLTASWRETAASGVNRMSLMSSPLVRWGAGALAFVALLGRAARCSRGSSAATEPAAETASGRARDARRRLPAGDLPSDVPGHRLRVEDQPVHALRVAALHRLPDRRRDAEERPARRDVHDRAAGDEAARAGRQGEGSRISGTATARR